MSSHVLELSVVALACLFACGPPAADLPQDVEAQAQRFAKAICEARTNCSCDDGRFESQAACESDLLTTFVAEVDGGMSLDSDCLDRLLDSEAATCAAWPWEEFDRGECRTLSRGLGVGEPCEWHGDLQPAYVTDCAEGLYCQAGVCVDEITFELEIGEPCEQGVAQPCVHGSYCGADDICHSRALLGEPCSDFFGCDSGLYCAGFGSADLGTCAVRRETGDICDPRDWLACLPEPPDASWKGCRPADGEYRCTNETPGVCYTTFPLTHPE